MEEDLEELLQERKRALNKSFRPAIAASLGAGITKGILDGLDINLGDFVNSAFLSVPLYCGFNMLDKYIENPISEVETRGYVALGIYIAFNGVLMGVGYGLGRIAGSFIKAVK